MSVEAQVAPTTPTQETPSPSSPSSTPPEDSAVEAAFGADDDDSNEAIDADLMALAGAGEPDDSAASQPKSTPVATPVAPVTPVPSAVTPAAATPAQPVTPAAAAPAAPVAAPVEPAKPAPVQPAQPAAAAPAAVVAQPSAEPTYAQVRESNIQKMADEVFVLDPKTLDEWDLDKGKQAKDLSKLAATIYMVAAESIIHSVAQQFPGWLQSHQTQTKATSELENEFVSAFPGLKDHLDKVGPIAVAYRTANPNATRQDAIKAVGEIVHVTHGIPKPGVAPAAPSGPQKLPPVQLQGGGTPRAIPAVGVPPVNQFMSLAEQDALVDDD